MITPAVLRLRYSISTIAATAPAAPAAADRPKLGSVAVAEFLDPSDGTVGPGDAADFLSRCGLAREALPLNLTVRGDGAPQFAGLQANCVADFGACQEQTLDLQTVAGVAPGVPLQYYTWTSGDPMDYFVQINDDPQAALVHSLSFGGRERGYEQDGGARCNVEIMKAGARGMTIVASSGDSGVYYPGLLPLWLKPRAFQPMFPQTSPYVTVVGGTQFVPPATAAAAADYTRGGVAIGEEMGVMTGLQFSDTEWTSQGSSGGGFSNEISRPPFQDAAVRQWLAAAGAAGELPPDRYSNHTGGGRAYPDVAMLAGLPGEGGPSDGSPTAEYTNFYLRRNGRWTHEDGTSASAPAFAGVVALLNHARLSAGKPPMGFLNPFLYQASANSSASFHDVLVGDNVYRPKMKNGFRARAGWDPVSGLGSPRFGELLRLALRAVGAAV
jgi:tripeptidyl-peptidase-1